MDNNTLVLLHNNGLDGSTSFPDASNYGRTVVAQGAVQIDTAQYKFQGASGLFNGSDARLKLNNHADFAFGTSDFTIEAFIHPNNISSNGNIWAFSTAAGAWQFFISSGEARIWGATSIVLATTSSGLSTGTWQHIAFVRSGNTWTIYIDGVSKGSTTDGRSIGTPNHANGIMVGAEVTAPSQFYNGWMDEIRVSNVARYTSDFTPTTQEFGYDRLQKNPSLEWYAIGEQTLTPALQWETVNTVSLSPELQWKALLPSKFLPNIINYPFYFSEPGVIDSSVPMTISGCTVGYSIYLKDTGSSGNTIIEIYANEVLKDTITVSADGSNYQKIKYFDLTQMLDPTETFQIKVTSVATGAEDLKVNMYLMTFPFEMEELFYSNLLNDIWFFGINKEYLFETADYWTIDFNQPIKSVAYAKILDINQEYTDATYSIEDGIFLNSRLKINPYVTNLAQSLEIQVQDYQDKYHSFKLKPKVAPALAEYPRYVTTTSQDMKVYISPTAYRYSFDSGSSWSDWSGLSGQNITVDFSGQSHGTVNIKIQYQIENEIIEEDISLLYLTDPIDASVLWRGEYAEVTYNDVVPLDRIEVYEDAVLKDTVYIPVVDGLDSFSLDTGNKEIDIAAGTFFWNGEAFEYAGSSYSLADFDFAEYSYATQYKAIFGFDTLLSDFVMKIIVNDTPGFGDYSDLFPDLIRLWAVDFSMNTTSADFGSYTIAVNSGAKSLFEDNKVRVLLDSDKDIEIKIFDVAGRDISFDLDYQKVVYNIWRTLAVTRDNTISDSGIASAAWDDNGSTFWGSAGLPAWTRYEFGQSDRRVIVEVAITSRYSGDVNRTPKDFKIQGSNDAVNWTDIHTVSGESWTDDGPKVYSFLNATAYAFYRLYVTDSSGGAEVQVKEIELRESIGGVDQTAVAEITLESGEIHQSDSLNLAVSSEDWGANPDGPTE